MEIEVSAEAFRLRQAFTISRGSRTEARVLTVRVREAGVEGRGECVPYARYGETVESVTAQVEGVAPEGLTRAGLQAALPPGAARNALDCALWDLEAKRAGQRVWQLAGLTVPAPVVTAYTLSLDTPEAMQEAAAAEAHRPILKIKLGTADDLPRLEAVRAGAPEARIIVDANEGWTAETYAALAPDLARLGVALVEQPVPAGEDEALRGLDRPVPLCADESVHDRATLPRLAGLYDMVNIKLDKTGGFTEALELRWEAERQGFGVMVGCMIGSSLSIAPAVLLAQGAAMVDLDAPLLLAEDRPVPLAWQGAELYPPAPELWG